MGIYENWKTSVNLHLLKQGLHNIFNKVSSVYIYIYIVMRQKQKATNYARVMQKMLSKIQGQRLQISTPFILKRELNS